jgi:hypothetical protein
MATNQLTDNLTEQEAGLHEMMSGPQRAGEGVAGTAMTDVVDPVAEETYWRESCAARPYYDDNIPVETYIVAYRYGWESRVLYDDMDYKDVESHLRREWNRNDKGPGRRLSWDKAKHAIRDAWERVTNAFRAKERATRPR